MVEVLRAVLMLGIGLSPPVGAMAQVRDPTLPPKGYYVPGGGLPAAIEEEAGTAPRALQIVVRPHRARPLAVIDGQTVKLGAQFDERRLVRINETEVTLMDLNGRENLAMTPGVAKMPAVLGDARG